MEWFLFDWYSIGTIGSNGIALSWLVFQCVIIKMLFWVAPRWAGVHSTRPLVPMVRLVPMELHLVDWCSIGEMHIIIKTWNIFEGSCLSCGSFYSSISTNGTIGTNGIALSRSVFHCWNAYHYKALKYIWGLLSELWFILLVHWYQWCDWYQWNCA